jgi:hypothetical protein
MRDPRVAGDGLGGKGRFEARDLARRFAGLDTLPIHHRYACGIVPAVLQPFQPFK